MTTDPLPRAIARYGRYIHSDGSRRIIVDRCPYCGRRHTHVEKAGVYTALCYRGSYTLDFQEQPL